MIPPNDFKNRPDELKPREQMRAASDLRTMPSESLLAILLKTGAPGCDVVELARRLISAYGSLHNLVRADWRSLGEKIRRHNRDWPQRKILGIGDVKQMELAAAFELVLPHVFRHSLWQFHPLLDHMIRCEYHLGVK